MVQGDDTEPGLTVLVISFNTRDMTLACLRSLFQETATPCEVIVVDNASTDGSAEAISKEFPQVRLLAETANHGFAKANNIGAEQARGRFLLLLNPDTLVLDRAVDRLLDFAAKYPAARIWGGRTFFADGRLNPASCWRRMTLWGLTCQALGLNSMFRGSTLFNPEAYGGWDRGSIRSVDIVSGCFLLIAREDWKRLGGFHEDFFMYGEEADLCLRAATLIQARPRTTPEARIVHYGGASEKVRADKMVRLLKAKTMLIRRHFAAVPRPLALALFTAWPLSRYLAAQTLARVTGKPAWQARGETWAEIWARRAEWRGRGAQ